MFGKKLKLELFVSVYFSYLFLGQLRPDKIKFALPFLKYYIQTDNG